jgi:hypothetical protein
MGRATRAKCFARVRRVPLMREAMSDATIRFVRQFDAARAKELTRKSQKMTRF